MIWLLATVLGVVWLWNSGMQIGSNFTLNEFTRSATADRLGIDNTPNATQVASLEALVANVLQPLRDAVGVPVRITSGFRSKALNEAIDGSDESQHRRGEAADFKVDGMASSQVADLVQELGIDFDQLIVYAPSRGGHVHVSYTTRRANRRERLFAPAMGGYRAA